jgi:hypothetical protein
MFTTQRARIKLLRAYPDPANLPKISIVLSFPVVARSTRHFALEDALKDHRSDVGVADPPRISQHHCTIGRHFALVFE